MKNENYKKQIEEFFKLFRKYIEKYPPDEIPGMNKFQLSQLKSLLDNFDNVKDSINFEIYGPFDNAMSQDMLSMLIKKFREKLGDDADDIIAEEETIIERKEKEFNELPTEDRCISLIEAIDQQLKQGGLSTEEIDNLLDKRTRIKNEIKRQIQ